MSGGSRYFILSAILFIGIGVGFYFLNADLSNLSGDASGEADLYFFCAAGIKEPVVEVARRYEEEYGVAVKIHYGGSGTLLNNLKISKKGDLYLAGDSSYIDIARDQGLVREAIPLARMRPVIAVAKGNPKKIRTAADLAREDVKTAIANPDAASVGKQTRKLLGKIGLWDEISAAVRERGVEKPTVNEVANDVKIGSVDAGIIWDATVNQYDSLEMIEIPEARPIEITIGVTEWCDRPTRALHFARYLGAPEKGLQVFGEMGFPPVEGDAWAEKPELVYFSGTVNKLAIAPIIEEFEDREGVDFTITWNGCGILVAQMKGGAFCDVYHSCDESFMSDVGEKFDGYDRVSRMDIVIAVNEGNPKKIQSLKDLTQPGIKVGVCNPELSALGALTANLLEAVDLREEVMENVVVQNAVGDLLVTQMVAGDLDAAIVYAVNLQERKGDTDMVAIDHEAASSTQTFAIRKESKHKHLTQRFYDRLREADAERLYKESNFTYLIGDGTSQ